ncbi:hypothetical protein [Acinetobacter bouvetii]|nr:hypothetical protein [Acinetobacter bouvetii]
MTESDNQQPDQQKQPVPVIQQPDQQKHPNPPNPQPDQPNQHIDAGNPQKKPHEQPENPLRQQK